MAAIHDPIQVGQVRVRNRLVLPPITTSYAAADGHVTDEILGFYRQRSRHVGMTIVEATAVRPDGRLVPLSMGLWNDAHISGFRSLSSAIKAEGAAAVVQINHGGARSVPVAEGIRGASPSGVAFRTDAEPTVLTEPQITDLVAAYAAAAARAREAGFDGVEIHGAHFYLVSQFLSPLTNNRTDRYGGDAAGRSTFAVEVVRAVRAAVGHDFVVTIRLNAAEMVDGGHGPEDARVAARLLEAAGIDAIDSSVVASGGWAEVDGKRLLQARSAFAKDDARGMALPSANVVKKAVRIPVIGVGKLGAEEARAAVASGTVDMVAIGRQMIADPDTAGKILSGRDDEIVQCRECWACFGCTAKGVPLVCSTNHNPAGEPRFVRAG